MPPLLNSPSPFIPYTWQVLLAQYPGDLPSTLLKIIQFGTLVGYEGPEKLITSENQQSVNLAPEIFDAQVQEDLARGRIVLASPTLPWVCSPLCLVPKHDGGFRRTHNLSHPPGISVNAHIDDDYSSLKYTVVEDVLKMVTEAGQHSIILKRDIKEAFHNIPITCHI